MFLPILIAAAVSPSEHTVFTCRIGDRVAMVVREGSNLAYRSVRRGGLELQIRMGAFSASRVSASKSSVRRAMRAERRGRWVSRKGFMLLAVDVGSNARLGLAPSTRWSTRKPKSRASR